MAPSTSCSRTLRFDLFCLLLYAHASLMTFAAHTGSSPSANDALPQECVSLSEQWCPAHGSPCPCITRSLTGPMGSAAVRDSLPPPFSFAILCCHLMDATQLGTGIACAISENSLTAVGVGPIALHIRNSTLQGLAQFLDISPHLPMLSSLTVTHSQIPLEDMRQGPLTTLASTVACLNMSRNGMGDFPAEALMGLSQLRALDLSHNNITHLPDLPPKLPVDLKALWVDISGNEKLLCSGIKEVMSWNYSGISGDDLPQPTAPSNGSSVSDGAFSLVVGGASSYPPPAERDGGQPPVLFHNKEYTYCNTLKKDLWFHWVVRIPLSKIADITKFECPTGPGGHACACTPENNENSDFSVAVDCSGRGLTELPAQLPMDTALLNVTNNKITSLEPLSRNAYYRKIRDFYAENNEITSIEVLEGSVFLDNFQHLSLRRNKLTDLPMYMLIRMFNQDSKPVRYLYLGKNEYHCDCNTYSSLKDWILHNKKQVSDHEEMLCDSEVYNTRIIDLQADDVCLQKDWKDYLPFVVLVEVLLLIIIVTKVSYDYWIFKTKGYLPWPASQTPKLPCCDWAFDA